ncbi:putative MHC class I antigen protein [Naja naja]|nr:putative MHC class I antigen protein [Naja naja]
MGWRCTSALDGFYPREIDASWTRDGEVWLEETFHGSVAPADGTYHYWLSIRIDPKERGCYQCHVEHDGLQEPLDLALEEPTNSESNLGLFIIGCVVAALVLVGVIAGILVFFSKYLFLMEGPPLGSFFWASFCPVFPALLGSIQISASCWDSSLDSD